KASVNAVDSDEQLHSWNLDLISTKSVNLALAMLKYTIRTCKSSPRIAPVALTRRRVVIRQNLRPRWAPISRLGLPCHRGGVRWRRVRHAKTCAGFELTEHS